MRLPQAEKVTVPPAPHIQLLSVATLRPNKVLAVFARELPRTPVASTVLAPCRVTVRLFAEDSMSMYPLASEKWWTFW